MSNHLTHDTPLEAGAPHPRKLLRFRPKGLQAYIRWSVRQSYDLVKAVTYRRKKSSNCPVCDVTGTHEHFLLDCPCLHEERIQTVHELFRIAHRYPKLVPNPPTYAEIHFEDMLIRGLELALFPALLLLKKVERFIHSL